MIHKIQKYPKPEKIPKMFLYTQKYVKMFFTPTPLLRFVNRQDLLLCRQVFLHTLLLSRAHVFALFSGQSSSFCVNLIYLGFHNIV